MVIASVGQTDSQAPQSEQASSSTLALPSTIEIASVGHASTQSPQPSHFSTSTTAGIGKLLVEIKDKNRISKSLYPFFGLFQGPKGRIYRFTEPMVQVSVGSRNRLQWSSPRPCSSLNIDAGPRPGHDWQT
jgi:hypothetical protein